MPQWELLGRHMAQQCDAGAVSGAGQPLLLGNYAMRSAADLPGMPCLRACSLASEPAQTRCHWLPLMQALVLQSYEAGHDMSHCMFSNGYARHMAAVLPVPTAHGRLGCDAGISDDQQACFGGGKGQQAETSLGPDYFKQHGLYHSVGAEA